MDGDERVCRVAADSRKLIVRETLVAVFSVGPEGFTTEEEVSLNGLPARVRVERA